MKIHNRFAQIGAVFGAATLLLTGCATNDFTDASTVQETTVDQATEADAIMVEDAWVKAAVPGSMTAGFGVLENSSDHDATVVSVESPASSMLELHETVADSSGQMMMREVKGGFVVPAKDHMHLEPGGNHLMLMNILNELKAGDEVPFTLVFSDGSTLEFTAIVKDYAGANENYEGDANHDEMSHDHAEHGED